MTRWTPFPHPGAYPFDAAAVHRHWARLHAGDAEPCPAEDDAALLAGWALFHSGEFQRAADAGLALGTSAGLTLANKATAIYANYLEAREKTRLELLQAVAQRAQAQAAAEPGNASAWYWQAYALGRYGQGISVTKALAQGLGSKVKTALETTIELRPRHADAHVALGAFHAEVIDKVGALIGSMTYGARREAGLQSFQQALRLTPGSPIALLEYAHGLLMLEGEAQQDEATRLYQQAAACTPVDALERLEIDLAQAALDDD